MAEIKIEKKKPIWPWLLLLLGVLAAVWFFFFRNDEVATVDTVDTTEMIDESDMVSVKENNNVVESYTTFITSDPDPMGLDHTYSHESITKLADAVEAMATEVGYDVSADISKAKQLADEITKDPMATNHSDKIRAAAEILSTSLQNLQQAKYTSLSTDVTELKSAAMAIDPKVLTLDQKDTVKSFFRKAADLLAKMN